jgi:hypothetical protein
VKKAVDEGKSYADAQKDIKLDRPRRRSLWGGVACRGGDFFS